MAKKKSGVTVVKKEFKFRGHSVEDLKKMEMKDFVNLLTSRERRTIKRGLTDTQKDFMKKIKSEKEFIKTHARDVVIVPDMIGKKVGIHNGKEFVSVDISSEMLGHRLGEFAQTRKNIKHAGPGMGATRSSKFVPLK